MAYDLEEQEQIARLREWWAQHGTMVIIVIAACLATVLAIQGWRYYRVQQTASASALYQQMEQAGFANDPKRQRDIAAEITSKYGGTAYGSMAALVAARASVESGDVAAAKTQLKWLIDHAREDEFRDLARLRLAAVLLDEKNYAEALALVESKPQEAFAGMYAGLKGDILVAKGEPGAARAAYRLAMDKIDAQSSYRAMVQAKLDALGESK
jgi:predicted negative regulator of RcsB-dependent stress response